MASGLAQLGPSSALRADCSLDLLMQDFLNLNGQLTASISSIITIAIVFFYINVASEASV